MIDNLIDWNLCEKKFIKKVSVDNEKIESIIKTVDRRVEYLKQQKVDEKNVSFIVEDYYEAIKELLVALLLKNGLRSKNHQCLISYFYKKFPKYEAEARLISRMCYLRNRLDYYGELIDFDFYKTHQKEFENIFVLLKKIVFDKV